MGKQKDQESEQLYNGEFLRKLTLGDEIFKTKKTKYFIEPHISPMRYKEMEVLRIKLGFNLDYKKLFEKLQSLHDLLNDMNFADSVIEVHNLMSGVAELENNKPVIMRFCAMFINTENEDRRSVDEKVINEKIQDWIDYGIDQESFFKLAVSMVNGLKKNYEHYTLDISR